MVEKRSTKGDLQRIKKPNPINGVERSCGRKQSLPIIQTRRANNKHNLLL
jgi:hypothetical protein